jgi:hypothetical protein
MLSVPPESIPIFHTGNHLMKFGNGSLTIFSVFETRINEMELICSRLQMAKFQVL